MVIWLTGLSGVGKSTIGLALFNAVSVDKSNVVLVDGDTVRSVFALDANQQDYSLAGRRKSAERLQKISLWLDQQNIDVICSAISMFNDINQSNRELFSSYLEVHVAAPMSTLIERDNKGLYQSALAGQRQNVVGVDIPYDPPTTPDIVINNTFNPDDVAKYVSTIINAMKGKDDALPLHR